MASFSDPSPAVRSTRQRSAIVALLGDVDGFRSAQELHDELRRRGHNIGLTTVYRTLQTLAASNLLDTVRTDTGESVYRRCAEADHHHHLVCRDCGTAVELSGDEVETWTANVAAAHGFTNVIHTIELFGTCAECQNRPGRSSPARRPIHHTQDSGGADPYGALL